MVDLNSITMTGQQGLSIVQGNYVWLIGAVILILITLGILNFIKNFIVNSVLGLIAWGLLIFAFDVQLPFIPSLVISIIFGPAGTGTLLLLKFFGVL